MLTDNELNHMIKRRAELLNSWMELYSKTENTKLDVPEIRVLDEIGKKIHGYTQIILAHYAIGKVTK